MTRYENVLLSLLCDKFFCARVWLDEVGSLIVFTEKHTINL